MVKTITCNPYLVNIKMINRPLGYYLPVLAAVLVSILLVVWAVDEESHIQGSVYLPAGFAFKAYVPGRYAVYLDMDVYPENAAKHLANMKAVPHVVCQVRGAGHLDVLYPDVWQCGGLSRYTKASDGSTRILVPFAEFDILWPGNYEVRAAFNGEGTKNFLISLGATSMVATSLILAIIILIATLLFSGGGQKNLPTKMCKPRKTYYF